MPAAMHLPSLALPPLVSLPPWETDWLIYGPIPNPGDTQTWPGKIGWSPLPLDGATEAPEAVELLEAVYRPRQARSTGGKLDLLPLFDQLTGCPMAYLAATIEAAEPRWQSFSFGANWGTRWWINGELAYDSTAGNAADPAHVHTNQFCAFLRAGANLVLIRLIGGSAEQWNITLALPGEAEPTGDHDLTASQPPAAAGSPRPLRDYLAAGLRIEHRPVPEPLAVTRRREQAMAEHGVQAHWIGIVDHTGSPYAPSNVLPAGEQSRPEHADYLRDQVAAIHEAGMAAMTWYPGLMSRSTARLHPEWRHVDLLGREAAISGGSFLCPLTGYGQALLDFVYESVTRYDLDGFWFDGTMRSPDGLLGCACDTCRASFERETGLPFPTAIDWEDPSFSRWLHWRDDSYTAFWNWFTSAVRRRFPELRIAINHLHRLPHGFQAGLPLRRYEAELIAGTESQDDPFVSAFHARLQGAYHQPQGEVWMGLHKLLLRKPTWPQRMHPAYRYAHHAMATLTAGCMPSFGTPDPAEDLGFAYDLLAPLVNPRRDLIGGEPFDPVGLLLSGQAETWHFSRRPDTSFPANYWHTVWGWHNLLMEKQFPQELAFDDDLRPDLLARFRLLIAPYAVALADEQVAALRQWVEAGGCLVTSPDFASLDEWGQPAGAERLAGLFAPSLPPAPDASLDSAAPAAHLHPIGAGTILLLDGNPGLRFLLTRRPELADEVAACLRHLVPPRVSIDGPRRLHVGVRALAGRLLVHLHNFVAYSEAESFPNPMLRAPEPIEEITVTLRGVAVREAMRLIESGDVLDLAADGDAVTCRVREVQWGEIVSLII